MRRTLQRVAAAIVGVSAAVGVLAPAGATTGKRADFDLGLSSGTPGTNAALALHVVYKDPDDPDAKPPPIRKVVIAAPRGMRFNTDHVASCEASDEELRAEGTGACPEASRVGAGTLTADTGAGPPIDPVAGDLTLFNGGDQVIEVVSAPGTDRTVGFDRLAIDGSTLTGNPPTTPGGPPDGETAVRQIDFTIDAATGYVTTPPSCPASGHWTSTGSFGFADGGEETLDSVTPCTAAAPRRAAVLSVTPKRARVGKATRFVARVRGAGACGRGATVRIGGHRSRTDARGRVTMTVTVHRAGAHRATAKKPGCATLTAPFAGGAT